MQRTVGYLWNACSTRQVWLAAELETVTFCVARSQHDRRNICSRQLWVYLSCLNLSVSVQILRCCFWCLFVYWLNLELLVCRSLMPAYRPTQRTVTEKFNFAV